MNLRNLRWTVFLFLTFKSFYGNDHIQRILSFYFLYTIPHYQQQNCMFKPLINMFALGTTFCYLTLTSLKIVSPNFCFIQREVKRCDMLQEIRKVLAPENGVENGHSNSN